MDTSSVPPWCLQKKRKGRRFETWLEGCARSSHGRSEKCGKCPWGPGAGGLRLHPAPTPALGNERDLSLLQDCHANGEMPTKLRRAPRRRRVPPAFRGLSDCMSSAECTVTLPHWHRQALTPDSLPHELLWPSFRFCERTPDNNAVSFIGCQRWWAHLEPTLQAAERKCLQRPKATNHSESHTLLD